MPIAKNKLVATDTRYEMIFDSVDDRNPRERREGGILKSRCSPINHFISTDARCVKGLNDNPYTINIRARKYLHKRTKELGIKIDKQLENHLCYLLIRDNLCIFEDNVEDNENTTFHFEAIQSSNWNDVRFKPPPSINSEIGWRTEFRSADLQITAHQNMLFTHATVVLTRIITFFKDKYNFYVPISKVDENFKRANIMGAATEKTFYWRTNISEPGFPKIQELSISEIFEGKVNYF